MGKLAIKLDKPAMFCIIENEQLLLAEELIPSDVTRILDKVGDYLISEIDVYMKFDTRQDVEGVIVDRMTFSNGEHCFKISSGDFAFLKALAARLNATTLVFFSAYRHYATMIENGVIVDSYVDHNFVVASVKGHYCQSIKICSSERLQRTVESCRLKELSYASRGAVPELKNIETIDPEMYETLVYLQFVMFGKPCYSVNIATGEVKEYVDDIYLTKARTPDSDERKELVEKIRKNLGAVVVNKKRTFSIKDLQVAAVCILAGVLFAVGTLGFVKIGGSVDALRTKKAEQELMLTRQSIEERFLENGIIDTTSGSFSASLSNLDTIVQNGTIMSVRFVFDKIELTLFTLDEEMKDKALKDLSQHYTVDTCTFEKTVNNSRTNTMYMQYNVVITSMPS